MRLARRVQAVQGDLPHFRLARLDVAAKRSISWADYLQNLECWSPRERQQWEPIARTHNRVLRQPAPQYP